MLYRNSSGQTYDSVLSYDKFLDGVDVLAGDAYKVSTLSKSVDIHSLHTVACAFHRFARNNATVDGDGFDFNQAVGTADADGGVAAGGVGIDADVGAGDVVDAFAVFSLELNHG